MLTFCVAVLCEAVVCDEVTVGVGVGARVTLGPAA